MSAPLSHLVTVSGRDGPGIAEHLFQALGAQGVDVRDVEQIRIHGRLLLCVEVVGLVSPERDSVRCDLASRLAADNVEVSITPLASAEDPRERDRFLVTVLAPEVTTSTLAGVTGRIALCGGNIERIVRLAAFPVHSFEFAVAGGD